MDDAIFRAILNIQNEQIKAVLATIVRTEDSTPRETSTRMLIMENGQTIGTIGGGTVEKLVYQRALALMTDESEVLAEIQHIAINQELETSQLLACGGNLDILLEIIQDQHFWQSAQDLQMNGKDAVMITSLFSPYSKSIFDSEGTLLLGSLQIEFVCSAQKLQNICSKKQAEVLQEGKRYSWLLEPILKKERLLILGAGHVAREVAYLAKQLDFEITVIDNRADFAQSEFFPGVYKVFCSEFTSGIYNYRPSGDTYVVIATWSHQTDADCVKEVLKFEPKYTGMLGSTKKVASIMKKMQEKGYPAQKIVRLRAPIGLDIGAKTPAEIAISILAEIISVRRGV